MDETYLFHGCVQKQMLSSRTSRTSHLLILLHKPFGKSGTLICFRGNVVSKVVDLILTGNGTSWYNMHHSTVEKESEDGMS